VLPEKNVLPRRRDVSWGGVWLRVALPTIVAYLGAAPAWPQTEPEPPQQEDAAETRQGRLKRQREEKREQLTTYEAGFIERTLLAVDEAERPTIFEYNLYGFYPRLDVISRGASIGFGTRFWHPDIGSTDLDVHASATISVRGYEMYDFQMGRVPHAGESLPLRSIKGDDLYELGDISSIGQRFTLYAAARYQHKPQEDFFGLGPDSRLEDESSFLLQDASFELVTGFKLTPNVGFTLRGGLLQVFVAEGEDEDDPTTQELFDDDVAPGLDEQPDFTRLSAQLLIDFCDQPYNTHVGLMLAAGYSRFEDRNGGSFSFDRYGLDVRGFVPLGSGQRVLALRTYLNVDRPAAGSRVPFYFQESLGSSHTFRGFESFRFRGEKVLLLQAEYRWEAAPWAELALFGDAGTVARDDSDLEWSRLEADWGVGLRLKGNRFTFLRVDLAFSRETTRLLTRFSGSF
jgi:hypothetical protein